MLRLARFATLALLATVGCDPLWAADSPDTQSIRDLLYLENRSHLVGNVDQLMACYAPDVVAYAAYGTSPDEWVVLAVGIDSLRATYGKESKANALAVAGHPEWEMGCEVTHVNVKQDRAVAVAQYWSVVPDQIRRENLYTRHQSVWHLAKVQGQWRITGFIAAVTFSQTAFRLLPE